MGAWNRNRKRAMTENPGNNRDEILKDLYELETALFEALMNTHRLTRAYSYVYSYDTKEREEETEKVFRNFHATIEDIGDIFHELTEKISGNS